MSRILFYCINGTGLGHLLRCLAVARQVRRLDPGHEILFLTSSESAGLLWRDGFASVKVPSIDSMQNYQGNRLYALAHSIATQTVATFQPDVLVTDSQPCGVFLELMSPLYIVPKKVFLFGYFPNYFRQASYISALTLYQLILMPYKEEERGLFKVEFGDRTVQWVGDILVRSAEELLPRETVRRWLNLAPEDLVLYVGLGGGGNPKNDRLLEWVLKTLERFPALKIACAVQPLSRLHDQVRSQPNGLPVSHVPMVEYYNGFDAAISSAGFNCGEVVHAGLPVAWIPFGFPSTDQQFNAERFARQGFGRIVPMHDTPALETAVTEMLDAGHRTRTAAAMRAWAGENGAVKAARAILAFAAG